MSASIRLFPLLSLSLMGGQWGLPHGTLTMDWAGDWFISADLGGAADPEEMVARKSIACTLITIDGQVMAGVVSLDHIEDRHVILKGISMLTGFDLEKALQ